MLGYPLKHFRLSHLDFELVHARKRAALHMVKF